jgi:light-regulated signal transduction histidine kinase (bacteriophytochrome)
MSQFDALEEIQAISSDGNFYEVVSNSPDGIVITDKRGVIHYVNAASMILFGREFNGLVGKDFGFPIVSGDTTEIDILKQGSPAIVAEMRVVEISWRGEPALLATLRDMSERIKLNKELTRSNKDLEEFAQVISHDIKAPLRTLNLLSTWLHDDHKDSLTQEALDDLQLMRKTTNRMQKMVDDLLQYSKSNSSNKQFITVDLNLVCRDALDNLSEDVFRTNASISVDSLPSVEGDESQLVQLFQNIISNSLKYSTTQPEVKVKCTKENYYWHIIVTDNGIGIESKYLKSIFIPFNHLNSIDEYEGSGIGLATCQKIVERHQGRIWMESEYRAGSEMHVLIPAGIGHN